MVSRKKTFRRRRQGKTDYRRRLKLIKSEMPRASVRITNTKIMVQIIEFSMKGDLITVSIVLNYDILIPIWEQYSSF